jgi:3'-phosphoadenosine 5'-phosphosulfate sulfotransferase (PAPS reductase)/FAD synthetase
MMQLNEFDWTVINSSAGTDSQAMLDVVCRLAREQGALHRVVVVHADLGRVEWQGTRELAETQAKAYGVRFEVVKRPQGDLLDHVLARGKWPSPSARYCTSDHKRGPVTTLFTRLTRELNGRHARILNCLGLRAEESPARAKRVPFELDRRDSNGKRTVFTWLPIHDWTTAQVWERIRQSGVPYHPAYDLGMPRLSCCFCIFSPREALMLAGKHNPDLLARYVEVEKRIGHTFKANLSLADVQRALDDGEEPGPVRTWSM